METMNAIERTLRVLDGGIPDRVPVDLHNFLVTARLMKAASFADFFRSGEAMAEGQIQAWKLYGHDVLILENGTAALAQACGVSAAYQDDTAPVAKEPAIRSLDEVDDLKIPDPYSDPVLRGNLTNTRIVAREIGKQAFLMGRADQGPFSLASEIRGMSSFMMDLLDSEQLPKVHRLLDFCRQVCFRYAVAQIEQGAHCTSFGDSPAGPDMISPRFFRQFAYPAARQLIHDLQSRGIRVAYHICGNATPIIGDMAGTGAAILEIDQKTDMRKAKAAVQGRKATFLGPVDPSQVMTLSSPEVVTQKCREAIEILGAGGGLILGPGCALPATTPDENIHALVAAARIYGTYA